MGTCPPAMPLAWAGPGASFPSQYRMPRKRVTQRGPYVGVPRRPCLRPDRKPGRQSLFLQMSDWVRAGGRLRLQLRWRC